MVYASKYISSLILKSEIIKKFYIFILTLLILAHSVTKAQTLSTNGYAHTPQGELHILLLFAGTSTPTYDIPEWEYGTVPDWAFNMFESEVEDIGENNNLSKYYYELSKFSPEPFKVTATVYPDFIPVASKLPSNVYSWLQTNDPTFPYADFDNRDNKPDFLTDNSSSASDNALDYVVIIWRDNSGTDAGGAPVGSGSISAGGTTYSILNGHEHGRNSGDYYSNVFLFVHEFTHQLFHSTHYSGANQVVGQNFYTYFGWGMMSHIHGPFKSANAWEMWWLSWLQGVTTIEADVANNGTYYLNDFIPRRVRTPLYKLNCATLREIPYHSRVNRTHRTFITIA